MTKRIDIVGFGYVGKTIYNSLTKNTNYTLRIVDPKYPESLWKKVFKRKADCAIISIPTPDDDYTDLISIANGYHCPVLIKSTVLPSIFQNLNDNVSHSPEFLRQDHAYEDFEYARHMIISANGFDFWKDIFRCRPPASTARQGGDRYSATWHRRRMVSQPRREHCFGEGDGRPRPRCDEPHTHVGRGRHMAQGRQRGHREEGNNMVAPPDALASRI